MEHQFKLDLGNICVPANAAVQRAIYMAHIGMSRLDGLGDVVASLGTDLAMKYQAPPIYPSNEAMIADYRWWVMSGVFRDVVEAVVASCTEAYFHLLVLQLIRPDNGMTATGEEYNAKVRDPVAAYKKLVGLPRKFNALDKASRGVLPELTGHARTVNIARNCLVHAHGIVGPDHATTPAKDALVVRWRSPAMVRKSVTDGVEYPAGPGTTFSAGDQLGIRWTDKEKVFPVGSLVAFDEDELVGVCFGVTAFAEGLRANVEKVGRLLGHFQDEAPAR